MMLSSQTSECGQSFDHNTTSVQHIIAAGLFN